MWCHVNFTNIWISQHIIHVVHCDVLQMFWAYILGFLHLLRTKLAQIMWDEKTEPAHEIHQLLIHYVRKNRVNYVKAHIKHFVWVKETRGTVNDMQLRQTFEKNNTKKKTTINRVSEYWMINLRIWMLSY